MPAVLLVLSYCGSAEQAWPAFPSGRGDSGIKQPARGDGWHWGGKESLHCVAIVALSLSAALAACPL